MSLLLYINGQRLDLEPGQHIAQTKQVNDLNSLDNRQCSYTNKFKVPKTATNTKIMQFLTLPGNISDVPYKKNECSLYSSSGECFVYKGWAVVTDGGTDYEVVVYDGIIDLYKVIENTSMADLDLEALTHDKTIENVLATWDAATVRPYRYILADYNGNIGDVETGKVNIDYVVPSVNVSWLWGKVFDYAGSVLGRPVTFQGNVFDTFNFKNLWMTFPKGVSPDQTNTVVFKSENFKYSAQQENQSRYARFNDAEINTLAQATNNTHFKVAEAGQYNLNISGVFTPITGFNTHSIYRIFIAKNAEAVPAMYAVPFMYVTDVLSANTSFSKSLLINLTPMDSISIVIQKPGYIDSWWIPAGGLNVQLTKLNQQVDFGTALADFSTKDFLNEVVHRFGLTMYKDKYADVYRFLTLQEQLQTAETEDWSGKFSKKLSESYVYGSYAQNNWLRYNYNNKDSSYNDWYLKVNNKNLPDTRDVIKSKIYSPEKFRSPYFHRTSNVYKLWDKEAVDNPEPGEAAVSYKPLDKRYYLLRAERIPAPVTITSAALSQEMNASSFYMESSFKLPFYDIVQDYYLPLEQILERSALVNAEMWLTDADVAAFDFRKLYYIKQLSNYYLVNKINSYVPGKPTKCELVRVLYDPMPNVAQPIAINKVITQGHGMRVFFDLNVLAGVVNLQILGYGVPGVWSGSTMGANHNPRYFDFTPTGTFRIRMEALGYISNEVEVTIPSNTTIEL